MRRQRSAWSHFHFGAGRKLHIELPLGVVNIRTGLRDCRGRAVDSVEVIPSKYLGERKIVRRGLCNTRLVELNGVLMADGRARRSKRKDV